MAAVIDLHTGSNIVRADAVRADAVPSRGERPRPQLSLIQGGRSEAGRHLRRTYLLRRLVAVAVAAVLLAAAVQVVGAVAGAVGGAFRVPVPEHTTVHRVASGDTLWSIAGRVAPQQDRRDVVDQIVALNGADGAALSSGAALQVGQQIVVPARDAG